MRFALRPKRLKKTFTGLTMDEVLAQGIVFLPTGYDTTAVTVAFILYNLDLNPEIQENVHEEILRVAGNEVLYDSRKCHSRCLQPE